jgi:tetratricopeptide (TPR) repeat protein
VLNKDAAGGPQSPSEHTLLGEGRAGLDAKRQAMQTAPRGKTPEKISVSRLPITNTGSDVFGREEDLAFLDRAWANQHINVVTIVAWAGVGKSTLVNHWLERMAAEHYRSADLVFGWSFYRQGSSGGTSSADEFLDATLAWFGDPDPRIGTAWEKGERLAKFIAHRRTLLVLDGLEPLQNPPGPQEGRLREPSLQALLRELAAFNTGLASSLGGNWLPLRILGRAQFKLKAFLAARATWERVLEFNPDDVEPNLLLGTTYQRLGDLTGSDNAVQKALNSTDLTPRQRAEAYALRGSNAKARWRQEWSSLVGADLPKGALQSASLREAQEQYMLGFGEDLNHFYSGLNALALLTVRLELARMLPDVWVQLSDFADEQEAKSALAALEAERGRLATTVERSIAVAKEHDKEQAKRTNNPDVWIEISLADYRCLTTKQPTRVADTYRRALARGTPFDKEAVRRQLNIYQQLGVLRENVEAALALPEIGGEMPKSLQVFVFTGHQIDSPGRANPRFPAAQEEVARRRIKEELAREIKYVEGPKLGIAGAASGGDLLFHEVCAELGIPTHVYLALPDNKFINTSVAPAGGAPGWSASRGCSVQREVLKARYINWLTAKNCRNGFGTSQSMKFGNVTTCGSCTTH